MTHSRPRAPGRTRSECAVDAGSRSARLCPAWHSGRFAVGGGGRQGGETRPTARSVPLQELEELQKQPPQYLRNLRSEEDDVLEWHALLLPVSARRGRCWAAPLGRRPRPAGRARPGEDFPCRRILRYYYFHFWLHRVSIAARGLSGCGDRGLPLAGVPRLLIGAAPLVSERGLNNLHTALAAPQHMGSSRTSRRTRVPCIGRWSPSY